MFRNLLFFTISIFMLIGCGRATSTGDNSFEIKTACFITPPVKGLSYIINSQEKIIGEDGRFIYNSSDKNIEFKLGSIILGSIKTSDINKDGKVFIQDILSLDKK